MLHNLIATTTLLASSNHNSTTPVPLTTNEALSGIFGSISLACWIFLLVPQLIENYKNQSAEAISLAFIIVWFIGDVANLLGALWANLVPTVIATAVYFCFSDGLLISQILYYGIRNKRREGRTLLESFSTTIMGNERSQTGQDQDHSHPRASVGSFDSPDENEPLLARRHSRHDSIITIPGSADPKIIRAQIARRRSSAGSATNEQERPSNLSPQGPATARRPSSSTAATASPSSNLAKILEEPFTNSSPASVSGKPPSIARTVFKNTIAICGIAFIGGLGWLIAYKTGAWAPVPPPSHHEPTPDTPKSSLAPGALFLGYLSAAAYLLARLPQIYKNYTDKSCEGLSLLFFVLSLLGNATYGAGILCHSTQGDYVTRNLPWLIGSLGTMVEDGVVFAQFRWYGTNGAADEVAIVEESDGYGATLRSGTVAGDRV